MGVVQRETLNPMNQLEKRMCNAILYSENWSEGNTAVIYRAEDDVSEVYLYGTKIAEVGDMWIQVWAGDFRTPTTKSRLNAILASNAIEGEKIVQEGWQWYVKQFCGQMGNVPFFMTVPFSDGLIFS